jgi:toxin ParE1/3/4
MAFEIVWTEKSAEDVQAIVRYIRRHNPHAASSIARGIYERVQILIDQPESGSVLEELGAPEWRKLVFRSWKIVYKVEQNRSRIVIIRVWHAAQGEVEL